MGNRRRSKPSEAQTRELSRDALQVLLTANTGLLSDEALTGAAKQPHEGIVVSPDIPSGCPASQATSTAAEAQQQQEQQEQGQKLGQQQVSLSLASWSQLRELVSWFSSTILPADKSAKLSFAASLPKECRADVHTLVSKKFKSCCESVSEGFGDDRYVAVIGKGAAGRHRRVPQEQADHALALWLLYKQHRRQQKQQQQQPEAGEGAVSGQQQQLPHNASMISSGDLVAGTDALHLQDTLEEENSSPAAAVEHRDYSRDEVAQMLMQDKLTDELAALWFGAAGEAQRWSRDICLAAAAAEVEEVQALIASRPDLVTQSVPDLSSGGQLPLHLAASSGAVEVLRLLLTAGADVTARNGSGETALQVAQRCEQCDCEAILIQAGAVDTRQDSWQNFKGEL